MDRNKIDEYINYASRMRGMFEGEIYTQGVNRVAFETDSDRYSFTSMIENHNNDNDLNEGDEGYIHFEELYGDKAMPNIFDRISRDTYAEGGNVFGASGIVEVKPKHASREEVEELQDYLEDNSWGFNRAETNSSRQQQEHKYFQIETTNVSREEIQELQDYLEQNSWDYSNLYAKGGKTPLDKEFKFEKNFVIYVPSTSNVGDRISETELDKRVSEVEKLVADEFGGFTKTETDGGYKSQSGEIIEEDIVKVSVFSTDKAWDENEKGLVRAVKVWAKEWGQEAIGFEYEGDLYYIDATGKMAKGGKTYAHGGEVDMASEVAKKMVSSMTDDEVARKVVQQIYGSLDSLESDIKEEDALLMAKKDIESSRRFYADILKDSILS